MLSAFFWSYALLQIPMGVLADRVNLRWLYAAAFTLWSVSQGLMGFATGLGTLIVFRMLLGIGEAIYLPGGSKIVSLLFRPAERGLPCGLFDAGTRTGLVIEGVLVPWMLVHFGWRASFSLVGFAALLWLIPWLLTTPKNLHGRADHSATSLRPGFRSALTALLTNRNLLGVCLTFFCFDYYWYFLVNWLPDYLVTARGLTILRAGIYAALPYFVFGASEPIGGWIADRLIRRGWTETRARKGVVTVAFLTGLLLIPAARVDAPGMAVALIIGGCLVGLATGNLLVILQSCAPRGAVGLVDRRLQFHRQHCRDSLAPDYRVSHRENRIVHAAVHSRGRTDRAWPDGTVVDCHQPPGRELARGIAGDALPIKVRNRDDIMAVVAPLLRWTMSAATSGLDSINARPRSVPRTLTAVSRPSASRPCRAITVTVMSLIMPIPDAGSMTCE